MRSRIGSAFLTLVVIISLLALGGPARSAPPPAPNLGNISTADTPLPPITGVYKTAPNQPAPKGVTKHRVPPKAGGVSTFSLTTGYHYAAGQSVTTQASVKGTAWMAKPIGVTAPGHSLWEVTAQYGSVSGPYRDNIVEAGVAVSPAVFGDSNPHLFMSAWWLNGTTDTWCGSYFGGCGWADNALNPVNVGADVSADIGTGKQIAWQYQATGCVANGPGWFANYAGGWVGCYPTVGGASRLSASMTTGQFWQAFGEVQKQGASCYQMGNGVFPTTTTSPTSYFSALTHSLTGGPAGSFSLSATDPTVFGVLAIGASPGGTFRYGGTEPAPC